MKEKLLGKTLDELRAAAASCGLKPFVGSQLASWLYVSKVHGWDEMTNIGRQAKATLSEHFELGIAPAAGVAVSTDGTKKYLFEVECTTAKGKERSAVEAVMIPDDDRKTLCVSSQAGCRMGCKFCMTGRQGWHGNLDAADILNQFISIEEKGELTNAVFMGMGEPLDNYETVSRVIGILTADWGFGWSPKRITVSTIGVIPLMKRLIDEHKCHIAVSLHNPLPAQRAEFMPVQRAWSITEVVRLLKKHDFSGQRRVSFEYTLFRGWNDSKPHALALATMLKGLECRVNLIRFHKIPDFDYDCPSDSEMEAFKRTLAEQGILCTIRASRGEDILAACGMLAGQQSWQ